MLFTPAWWVCVEKSLECMPPQPAASLSLYIQDLGQSFSLYQSIPPNQYIHVTYRPTTIHWCTGTSPYFWHNTNIIYWTSYRDIYDAFTYVSTNMGKHCLQLVLTLLPLIFKMAHTTNTCMLPIGLVSRTDFWTHEQDTRQYPSCFDVILRYHIVYRIMTTVSGYVSLWKNVSLQAW